MIKYIEGNIFDSPAQVIVNTVNTVGVMGKGLALSFKQRYPEMFECYKKSCEKHQLTIGKLMLWYAPDHWLLLFPTKENWRNPSRLEYIEKGLMKFVNTYVDKNITSIAFPRLGCGNGELDWNDVKPLMEKYLKDLPIDVYIYLGPKEKPVPEHQNQKGTLKWLKENAKDMSFNSVKDDIISTISEKFEYLLSVENESYKVSYNDGLIFENNDSKIMITESDFYKIWDNIRNSCVFKDSEEKPQQCVYALLCHLNYLTNIDILDTKTNKMVSGYQVNEATGRLYTLGV